MITLSLCMIVKNEENTIERCLSSCYSLFDEIIIVDTGSTDKTKEICKKFTDKIYDFIWVNDFSKARNFGIEKCTSNYFMWLDADDVITKENLKKLQELKTKISNEDVIMLKYDIAFDEKNNPTFSYYRERILKNNANFLFHDPVHEAIIPSGNIVFKDISIQHRKVKVTPSDRNLKIYESLNKKEFTPRQFFYYARELFFNNKIDKAIINFKKFLKQKDGFFENKIDACKLLSKCYLIKNNVIKAKEILFYSFNFDIPRAEILCEIGYIYKDLYDYNKAIYYFNLATQKKPDKNSLGFVEPDYYNFIPFLELCVCHYNLNNPELALTYNTLAKQIKPTNTTVLNNEKFLKDLIEKQKIE